MYNQDNIFQSTYTPNSYENNNCARDFFFSPTFPNYSNNESSYFLGPYIAISQENGDEFNEENIIESSQPKNTLMNKLYEIGNTDISKKIKTKETSKGLKGEREKNKIKFEKEKGLLRKKVGRKKKKKNLKVIIINIQKIILFVK